VRASMVSEGRAVLRTRLQCALAVRHQIVVAAQGELDADRRPRRNIGIGRASRYHAHRPIALDMAVGNAVDGDIADAGAAGLMPDFGQGARPQIGQRKQDLCHSDRGPYFDALAILCSRWPVS
jgi:hypothetical protein